MAQFTSPTGSAAKFHAGPYNAAYGGVSIGLMRGGEQSPRVEVIKHGELIRNTHLYGQTPIGNIVMGGEAFANFVAMEWLTTLNAAIWSGFGSGGGGNASITFGTVPTLCTEEYDSLANTLIFTVAGTNMASATGGIATLTASKAVIVDDNPIPVVMGPVLREFPFRFRLFPHGSSSMTFWTETANS